jgi:hypothetical protein
MSSGGDAGVEYTQSPEQRKISQAVLPMVQGMGKYGTERYFGGAPQMGAPSMGGVLTGQPMYDIPSPSLAPQVKAGLYAPYVEAGQGLMEMMGSRGQAGSPQGGFSGAAGAAMGELAGQAAKNVGLNAWQMTAPMAMNAWNADLMRNQTAWQQGQQERMGDYQTSMNVWNRPMQAMGMLPASMPQGVVQQGTGGMGSILSGAGAGAMAGGSMFGWPGALGGGLFGGLTGAFY